MKETIDKVHNILVIGNGFDLYHGRKTNFMDFVRCVENAFSKKIEERTQVEVKLTELCNVNGFFRHFHFTVPEDTTWSDFETEMDHILHALIHFCDVMEEQQKDVSFDPVSFNIYGGLFSYRDLQIFKHFSRLFEQIYDDPAGGMFKLRQPFITPEKVLHKKALADEVRNELELFTQALDLYVTACADAEDDGRVCPQIASIHPDYVINFNYTDTICRYGLKKEQIFYAKGKAGCEPANLVLGAPDDSESHPEFLFLRTYFQSLLKSVAFPEWNHMYPENGYDTTVIAHFFGYSFWKGDKDILEEIFTETDKVVVYYTDPEDYAKKAVRLMELFGKVEIMERFMTHELVFEQIES